MSGNTKWGCLSLMGVLAIAKSGQIGGFWLGVEEVAEDEVVVVIRWWKSGSGKHDVCENNVLMLGGSAGMSIANAFSYSLYKQKLLLSFFLFFLSVFAAEGESERYPRLRRRLLEFADMGPAQSTLGPQGLMISRKRLG